MSLTVVYEDNHLLCVIKPRNMPVQADSSGDPDLLTLCGAYIKEKYGKPGDVYIGLVHRLDRPVGGVMVFARTSKAASRLSEQIRLHTLKKTYFAVVCGSAPNSGRLENWLLKDENTHSSAVVSAGTAGAKQAVLTFEKLDEADGFCLLKIALETGRHHQIRVQLASAGFPIWGDQRYNPEAVPGQQLALYAAALSFDPPTKKTPVSVSAPLPNEYPWSIFKGML